MALLTAEESEIILGQLKVVFHRFEFCPSKIKRIQEKNI